MGVLPRGWPSRLTRAHGRRLILRRPGSGGFGRCGFTAGDEAGTGDRGRGTGGAGDRGGCAATAGPTGGAGGAGGAEGCGRSGGVRGGAGSGEAARGAAGGGEAASSGCGRLRVRALTSCLRPRKRIVPRSRPITASPAGSSHNRRRRRRTRGVAGTVSALGSPFRIASSS